MGHLPPRRCIQVLEIKHLKSPPLPSAFHCRPDISPTGEVLSASDDLGPVRGGRGDAAAVLSPRNRLPGFG